MTVMSDETIAGTTPGAGAGETEIIAPIDYPPTPTAWSLADDDEAPTPRSWREAWSVAAVLIAIAAVAAGIVCAVVLSRPSDPDQSLPAPAPPSIPDALPAAALPPISSAPVGPPDVAPPPIPLPEEWVAGAVSQRAVSRFRDGHKDVSVAGLFRAPTQRGAMKGALDTCAKDTGNSDCGLINNGVHLGCIAYMIDMSTGAFAGGSGPTDHAAIEAASSALGAQTTPVGDSYCSERAGEARP